MMNDSLIKIAQQLLSDATAAFEEANQLMQEAIKTSTEESHDETGADSLHALELILQYRLDTQSIFVQLGQIQHTLLQCLGVESQSAFELNKERLSFALGGEELQHILSLFHRLLHVLLVLLARHSGIQKTLTKKKAFERSKNSKNLVFMEKMLAKLRKAHFVLQQVNKELQTQLILQEPGVVYNYIAALEGPISRFQQAMQHGLILAGSLVQQLQERIEFVCTDLISNHEMELNYIHDNASRPFFKPQNTSAEQLEVRAATKRLGNFFNH